MTDTDSIMMLFAILCVILSLSTQQQRNTGRINELIEAKPDTVYVVALKDSVTVAPDSILVEDGL